MSYRGRFAPSPTGELHLGSAVAAVASFLDAKTHDGVWLIRVDDIDPPREVAGATTAILQALAVLGLEADEPPLLQSTRLAAYDALVDKLSARGLTYYCQCTRKDLKARNAERGHGTDFYDGRCRDAGHREGALRLRADLIEIDCTDRLQGPAPAAAVAKQGDFIIRRRDGLIAYHVACVADEAFQQISDVVRGDDLWPLTPRHVYLQRLLELPSPRYLHLPVLKNADGQKLSKQFGAAALALDKPRALLARVLGVLGIESDPNCDLRTQLVQAIPAWSVPQAVASIAQINDSVAAQQNELR